MTKRLIVITALVLILQTCVLCAVQENHLFAVKQNNKWGYINSTGRIVIKPQFSSASPFSDGLARISVGKDEKARFGFIDKTGKTVIKPQFASVQDFHDGMASIQIGWSYGFINKTGKIVVKPKYGVPGEFHEGLAAVRVGGKSDGKWGYIDKNGKMIIQSQAGAGRGFSEGLTPVEIDGKWGFIDKVGKLVIKPQFDEADTFSEGLASIAVGKVNYTSKKTGKTDPDIIMDMGKFGYIDKTGKVVIQPQFGFAMSFHEGLAAVKTGSLSDFESGWGYIDKTGKIIIPLKFLLASEFSEGLAAVTVGSFDQKPTSENDLPKSGYIDKTGNIVIQPQFGMIGGAGNFMGGLAQVNSNFFPAQDDHSGPSYIDKTGKFIWKDRD